MKDFFKVLKKIWPWAIIGLVVRLVLMPTTLHSDLWAISFSQYLFSFKGVVNIYDYLANLPAGSALSINYGSNFFTYPPLAYFSLGIFGLILRPFANADFLINLASRLPNILNDSRLYGHLFLTKLPYLFFDFGILWLVIKMFEDEKKKILAAILWIFNPFSLYSAYMVGQFDIIAVFWTVLAVYLYKQKKVYFAAVCLGIGGGMKMFPLFFIPILALSAGKDFKTTAKIILFGFLPYVVSILPFIGSPAFRQTVLLSNQSQKMLFMKLPVSGAEYLSVFLVLYIFLVILSSLKKVDLWKWFLAVLLLFFSVTHYHPQWYVWVAPFLLFFWVEHREYKILAIILFLAWVIITLLFEPSLSVSLFAPLNHSLLYVKPLSEQLNNYYNVFDFKSLIRSLAAGVSLAITVLLVRDEKTD